MGRATGARTGAGHRRRAGIEVVPGIAVDDITATTKTLPEFPVSWAAMLAGGAG